MGDLLTGSATLMPTDLPPTLFQQLGCQDSNLD
jgi:hypothetical protein